MHNLMKTTADKLFGMFTDPNYFMLAASLGGFKIAVGEYIYNDWQYVGFLTVLIIVDTILGLYKAWKNKNLESRAWAASLKRCSCTPAFLFFLTS
ncbi:MAG: hypothetical protein E6R03_10920 [Hyphomicrobiaceae bacterium]|nr:MAG: hypothetical protein E6R03_10920 [Hyphomicrobiaceae bacterium]